MGFRVGQEHTYHIAVATPEQPGTWLHDMTLERADGGGIDLSPKMERLEACFIMVMRGIAENDGYNALVLVADLWWRDVALIRTISRFLRQIRVPYSQDYMWATLRKHATLATKLVELFQARFDPRIGAPSFRVANAASEPGIQTQTQSMPLDSGSAPSARPGMTAERRAREATIVAEIEAALADVASLDEDRIIRQRRAGGNPHQLLPDRHERPTQGRDRDQVREP
jgi:NAD-specific glutamate dehydrogenase